MALVQLGDLLLYGIPGLLVAFFLWNVLREFLKDPGRAVEEIGEGIAVLAFWAAVAAAIWLLFKTGIIET